MPKRNHDESAQDNFFDILSLENEKESVKKSFRKEYQNLTPSGKDFNTFPCYETMFFF